MTESVKNKIIIQETDLQNALDDLQHFYNELENLKMEMDDSVMELIPDDVFRKIEIIKAQYATKINRQKSIIEANELAIKELITHHGKSIKGNTLHAVYSNGRVTWDTKGLNGYMVAHPEIEAFRKVGSPSVSIRKVK
jgi:hypothetical protein